MMSSSVAALVTTRLIFRLARGTQSRSHERSNSFPKGHPTAGFTIYSFAPC